MKGFTMDYQDVTDPRDIGAYEPVLDDDLPDRVDFAVAELQSALYALQELEPHLYRYDKDIQECLKQLTAIAKVAEMPF